MTIIGAVILAVLLVIAGLTLRTRNKNTERAEYEHEQQIHNHTSKQARKAQRAQSKNARRKRH